MKKFKALAFTIVFALLLSGGAMAESKTFTDVNTTHWAKSSIDYLTEKEIIFGYADGRYGTNDPITRAQAASMIMRYFGWGDLSGQEDPGYPDLTQSHWAYNEIAALYAMDIFRPEGDFRPNLPVTRAEMADMLVKTFQLDSIIAVKFTDLSREHWAYESINILAGKGASSGYPDGTFRPEANVTRAEFAVLMTKVMREEYSTDSEFEGAIYDLEIGGQVYQLEHPLLLTDRWYAPVELFEKMGYYVESQAADKLSITTADGRVIQLHAGQQEVWVGDTSAQVDHPLVRLNGLMYIAAHEILEVLEKPLVFYPDQFLIRLASPKVTVADINRQLPEAAVDVIHSKQPYWHWAKRDRDYLELIRRGGLAGKEEQLLAEMKQLTEVYFAVEKEKRVIRGLNYFSDSVTGKIDAISRGLEARYSLLHDTDNYVYPSVGTSGSVGVFGGGRYEFDYVVSDHFFAYYEDNKQALIDVISSTSDLPLAHFEGLNVHAIPFFIGEETAGGDVFTWAGLASGSRDMLVVNSGIGTFIHEFGHNWDSMFGDADAYLQVRGKSGYVQASADWVDRVGENFAEDFVGAYLLGAEGYHKGAFGQPTDEQTAAIRQFVMERTPSTVSSQTDRIIINGATLLPDVVRLADGKLHVQGRSGHYVYGTIVNVATGEETMIDLSASSSSFDQVVQLPQQGVYEVTLGGVRMIVIYK